MRALRHSSVWSVAHWAHRSEQVQVGCPAAVAAGGMEGGYSQHWTALYSTVLYQSVQPWLGVVVVVDGHCS